MSTQDDDFARELQAHLEHETDALIRDGVDPDAARRRAHLALGNTTLARERNYERARLLWLDHLRQDIRGAFRSMRRYPISALVAVLSLAFGIGATTVTLTVRNVLFRKPPPLYQQADQIARLQIGRPDNPIRPIGNAVPSPLFAMWQARLGPAIAGSLGQTSREVRTGNRSENVPLHPVTPNLFTVLGVEPLLGRTFSDDGSAETMRAAVLSYRVWQQLFDAREDAIGAEFWIDNVPYTVVGVMPERFWFDDMNSPIWTAIHVPALTPDDALESSCGGRTGCRLRCWRRCCGRASTTTRGSCRPRSGASSCSSPASRARRSGGRCRSSCPTCSRSSVLLTLLIACANVAVLMIAQWTAREHEIAIRAVDRRQPRPHRSRAADRVGHSSPRSAASLGIGAALAAARSSCSATAAGRASTICRSTRGVLASSAVVAMLTGIVAGIAPALYETRRLHTNPLRSIGGIRSRAPAVASRARRVRDHRDGRAARADDVARQRLPARRQRRHGIRDRLARSRHASRILAVSTRHCSRNCCAALPGVEAAAASSAIPFAGRGRTDARVGQRHR